MTKAESERAIRQLVGEWAKAKGVIRGQAAAPSFAAFRAWARLQGHSHYFEFRSTMGAIEDYERWFDQEFGQTWRN